MVTCYSRAAARLPQIVLSELRRLPPSLNPRHIVIKPNWVMHETDPAYPIAALVTDARVVDAVVRACVARFPSAERITVGDCPEQRADWPLMCRQSGLAAVIDAHRAEFPSLVEYRDLRKDVYRQADDDLVRDDSTPHGDPAGYREVELHAQSHLEPIAAQAAQFSIHDHDTAITRQRHTAGDHRYLVCQTLLDADLVINLPKWKAHSKAGLTGALKNLVGINGDKSYLPHFRRGSPRWGGDEYSDEGRWLYWVQNNAYDLVRGTAAHRLLRPAWRTIRGINSALRRRDHTRTTPADFYVVGGSWYGNQTLWRMIYDLNMVIQRVDRDGRLRDTPQRDYFCIVDGLISGEGDGPLHARPRDTDLLICGDDPFEVDTALAWLMGFDARRIPMLAERHQYLGGGWGQLPAGELKIAMDDVECRLHDLAVDFHFAPSPGWIGHIERASHVANAS
ncbi:MAG: DUF362 domain-containing protein [Vicinamibacterales bacterium]